MKPSLKLSLPLSMLLGLSAMAQLAPEPSSAPSAPAEETVILSPFLVKNTKDRTYGVPETMGASRVALPNTDVPLSVIGVSEQLFADTAGVSALEPLSFVSGIQATSPLSPRFESFTLRGYAISSTAGFGIRDGLPDVTATAVGSVDDASAYERVEVIKGPAGALYGTTSMGGVINKISKWPKFKPETIVQVQAQSYDEYYRGMIDSTGPLTDRDAYRVVYAQQAGTRYWGAGKNDSISAVLAYTHLLGDSRQGGRIWARFAYQKYDVAITNGTVFATGWKNPLNPTFAPVLDNPRFAVPKEINNAPSDDNSPGNVRSYEAGFEYNWAANPENKWTVRLVGRNNQAYGDQGPSYSLSLPVPVTSSGSIVQYTNASGVLVNGTASFISQDDPRVADYRTNITLRQFTGYKVNSGGYLDIVGKFTTGPLKHTLVANGQLTRGETERAFFFWAIPNANNTTAVANSFSAVRPDFSNYNRSALQATTPSFNPFNGDARYTAYAGGVQDNIALLDNRLILSAGVRDDKIDTTTYSFDSPASIAARRFIVNPATTAFISNQEVTSKYGIVAKPLPGLSIFGQAGQTYIPINTLNPTTLVKFPNQEGDIKEGGVKLELLGGKLVGTASVFDMKLTNVLVNVINPPELGGGFVMQPAGTQKTKGYEMDLAWEPVTGLNVIVAYSKVDSKNEAGLQFNQVPRDASYSVFGKYTFQNGPIRGLYVGADWRHRGVAPGDSGNTFFLPASDIFDGLIGYGKDRWNAQLNILNLGNSDKIIYSIQDSLIYRAQDRTYRVTLTYRF